MVLIYNIFIRLYYAMIWGFGFFHPKAKLWINGRKDWETRLKNQINNNENWVWFHCSSVGEFEDFSELLTLFKKQQPLTPILLTFFFTIRL